MSAARKGEDGASPRQSDVPENPSDSVAGAPVFLVKGDATPEEVAALTVVLQAVAASGAAAAPEPEVRSEWSAHHRKVRAWHPAGPGGWRSSAMPR